VTTGPRAAPSSTGGLLQPPSEVRALAWARVALGALFLVRTTPLLAPLHLPSLRGTTPLLGWPDGRWHGSPTLALPAAMVAALCVVRTLAAVAFTLGVEATAAGLVAGIAGYLVLLQRPFEFVFTLHLLYQGTILLALAGAGGALALGPRPPRAPASGLLLMRLFVASIYAWAAIGKLRRDWLDGRTLEILLQQRSLSGRVAEALLATADRRIAVAWGVALAELALGPLLLWRKTRLAGLAVALLFHAGVQIVGRPDLLGLEMAALLICFLPGALRAHEGSQRGASAGQETIP
jgi:hypothetical protein